VRKDYRPKRARMRQLDLIAHASFALMIDGNRLYAPAPQALGDPHIYILIRVDF
jgi:hypothetical protein